MPAREQTATVKAMAIDHGGEDQVPITNGKIDGDGLAQQYGEGEDGGEAGPERGKANQGECGKGDGRAQAQGELAAANQDGGGDDKECAAEDEEVGAEPKLERMSEPVGGSPQANGEIGAEGDPSAHPAADAVVGAGMGNGPKEKDKQPRDNNSNEKRLHYLLAWIVIGSLDVIDYP